MTFRSVSVAQRAFHRALGIFLLALLAGLIYPISAQAAALPIEEEPEEVPQINTAEQLWAGYDPKAEPLEVEVVKKETRDGIDIETLRYTGETWKGRKVRVFAYRGAPTGGKNLPCIVHLHGGGQTASMEWIRFWAKRGYLVTSHDFCGSHDSRSTHTVTHWNGVPGEMAKPIYPGQKIHPSPQYASWYHWILLGRRAITLLQEDPRADPSKVGVFGISVGGTLTWMVAGCDPRVTAAAPIYGVGQNSYTYPWQKPTDDFPEDTVRWRTLMEPDGYASGVKCPILWINASNDHHGRLDLGMRTLDMTTQTSMLRMVFTPRTIHSIGHEEAPDLPMWMDYHLKGKGPKWPETPGLSVSGGDSEPRIFVKPDMEEDVESVKVYYGLNNPWPHNRFYRTAKVVQVSASGSPGSAYIAGVPVLNPDDTIYTFANVHYKNGIVLSTRLVIAPIKDLPNIKPTLKRTAMINPMDDSDGFFWWLAGTDPVNEKPYFKPWIGPKGEKGFTSARPRGFSYATTALGDPQWSSEGTQALLIDLCEKGRPETMDEELSVHVTHNFFMIGQVEYKYAVDLNKLPPAKDGWITLRLVPGDFKTKDAAAKPLESWKGVNFLWFTGKVAGGKEVVFKNLRWEELK